MRINKDYRELLKFLNENNVEYCIVGAYAVIFHARPRFTKDIDILINPTVKNSKRIIAALANFGFEDPVLTDKNLTDKKTILQMGIEPNQIHIMTSIDGLNFKEVWKNKVRGNYGNIQTYFIGLNELIKNKKVIKRLQDKIDLKILLKAKEKKQKLTKK